MKDNLGANHPALIWIVVWQSLKVRVVQTALYQMVVKRLIWGRGVSRRTLRIPKQAAINLLIEILFQPLAGGFTCNRATGSFTLTDLLVPCSQSVYTELVMRAESLARLFLVPKTGIAQFYGSHIEWVSIIGGARRIFLRVWYIFVGGLDLFIGFINCFFILFFRTFLIGSESKTPGVAFQLVELAAYVFLTELFLVIIQFYLVFTVIYRLLNLIFSDVFIKIYRYLWFHRYHNCFFIN